MWTLWFIFRKKHRCTSLRIIYVLIYACSRKVWKVTPSLLTLEMTGVGDSWGWGSVSERSREALIDGTESCRFAMWGDKWKGHPGFTGPRSVAEQFWRLMGQKLKWAVEEQVGSERMKLRRTHSSPHRSAVSKRRARRWLSGPFCFVRFNLREP